MALRRVVLNTARSISMVGYQLKGGHGRGFLGAINSGLDNYSYLNNRKISPFVSFSRRHYHLPPPPPVKVFYEIPEGGFNFPIDNPEDDDSTKECAQFAAKAHNEVSQDGGEDHVRFVRLVRAWRSINLCESYHMMLEAVDGKGEVNLYYAEVIRDPLENLTKLVKWELVDQSFSYPFEEARLSEQVKEEVRRLEQFYQEMPQEMEKKNDLGRESIYNFAYGACPTLILDTICPYAMLGMPRASIRDLHKNEIDEVN
ncbi:uncharacterized protein [Coffea arabica]|uniref:Uncharacterized protein isoform X2 n=1 Tax=Coffea arabica TaxID=13443 RepID=A0A6P6W6L1_COFAR|nr:uncharacterized protein LOC113730259 isoform X1 [Coffea arabica]